MGGKFRVKADGVARLEAAPILRRNRRRINAPQGFVVLKSVPAGSQFFLLGRSVATPDNERS
jgi:hypothetical protein